MHFACCVVHWCQSCATRVVFSVCVLADERLDAAQRHQGLLKELQELAQNGAYCSLTLTHTAPCVPKMHKSVTTLVLTQSTAVGLKPHTGPLSTPVFVAANLLLSYGY